MAYNSRIVREGGLMASVLSVASGGSLNIAAGGILSTSGTQVFGGGSVQIGTAASLILKPGATSEDDPVAVFNAGPNQFWYSAGSSGSPNFSGSPGDIAWIANSASTGLYLNVSDGTAGSKWMVLFGGTGSQIGAAP